MANSFSLNASAPLASITRRCIYLFLLTLCISNALVHAQEIEEPTACKDNTTKSIKIKGKKKVFCEWVAKKPDERCTSVTVKKKKKKNKRTGKKQKKNKKFNPKTMCSCTCADYELEEENDNVSPDDRPSPDDSSEEPDDTTGNDKLCPTDLEANFMSRDGSRSSIKSNQLFKQSCLRDGYSKGQECNYEWGWRGCRYGELTCRPDVVCRCADEYVTGDEDTWSCKHIHYHYCEARPRPNPDGSLPPYYVPDEAGGSCQEDEEVPKAPPGFNTEPPTESPVLEIRRSLRQ